MKWKLKNTKSEMFGKKSRTKFAVLPTKVNDNIIWLEKYVQVYIWTEVYSEWAEKWKWGWIRCYYP